MKKSISLFVLLTVGAITQVFATVPTGWVFRSYTEKSYKMYMDKATLRNGKAVPTIKSVKEVKNQAGYANLSQSFLSAKYKGQRIRMSGYMRTQNVTGWAAFWLRADKYSINNHSFDNMQDRQISATNDWTKYDIVLDIPDSATKLDFGAMLIGNGQIWVDNITFEIVDKSVSLTGDGNFFENKFMHLEPIDLNFDSIGKIESWHNLQGLKIDTSKKKQGWITADNETSGFLVDIDKGNGMNGTNAATIKSLNVKGKLYGDLYQVFYNPSYKGKTIKMTGYMRSQNLTKWAGFWINIYGPDGTGSAAVAHCYSNQKFKGNKDWTKCEIVFDVPVNSRVLMLGAFINGKGQIWIDNISFDIVGEAGVASGMTGKTLSEPVNLDFSN
jgi:hypothetical protein